MPPVCQARVEVTFEEIRVRQPGDATPGRFVPAGIDDLAAAMNLPDPEPVRQRLHSKRRCFTLKVDSQIAAYGWVTHGVECVGELERHFHLHDDEAYLWDFATLPAWRGQRLYSALLSRIIYRLHDEGTFCLWIGASRLNQPSTQGFANAGFKQVVDVTYGRLYRLTLLWIHQALSPQRPLVAAAYRILINEHEQRFGRLAIGYISGQ